MKLLNRVTEDMATPPGMKELEGIQQGTSEVLSPAAGTRGAVATGELARDLVEVYMRSAVGRQRG